MASEDEIECSVVTSPSVGGSTRSTSKWGTCRLSTDYELLSVPSAFTAVTR